MFSLFVRRDGLIDPPAVGEFDAHCHLLPGIDDGPKDERGTLAMARLLIEMGIKTVVATPHVISDVYPNTTDGILRATEKLRQLLRDSGLTIDVLAGAEYYAENSLIKQIEAKDVLCFTEKKYVLFESPVERAPMVLEDLVYTLKSNGYTPLLAHAERYKFLQTDDGLVSHLRNLGVHFQLNHPSFLLPKTSRRGEMARKLYIKGMVDMLGTDMHRATPWLQSNAGLAKKGLLRRQIGRI